jgi:AraC-like DNA-binding protein
MYKWKSNPHDPKGNVAYGNLLKEEFVTFDGDRNPPVFIDRIGITNPDPEYSVYRKINNVIVIEYVISGKGYLEIDGVVKEVTDGDVYIILPDVSCRYWADKKQPFKKIWVNVFSDMLVGIICKLNLDKETIYHNNSHEILDAFYAMLKMADEEREKPSIHMQLSVCIYEILAKLSIEQSIYSSSGSKIAQKACFRLNSLLYSNIKIKEISDALFVSENYLIDEYKKVYGKTPLQDLNSKRIDIIKNLLKNTDMRISDISRKLSFNSEHYFSTFFKKHTGMTPTKYRNMFKQ